MTDGSREQILAALERTRARVGPGGTAWVYFAGHGAASTQDGARMLLGVDVMADAEVFSARGVRVDELQRALIGVSSVLWLDTCYNGATRTGGSLLPNARFAVPSSALAPAAGSVVWTAAGAGQASSGWDPAGHGLFTYTAVGALRGWADGELDGARDGAVSAAEAQAFVARRMAELGAGGQTPQLVGAEATVLSTKAPEVEPAPPAVVTTPTVVVGPAVQVAPPAPTGRRRASRASAPASPCRRSPDDPDAARLRVSHPPRPARGRVARRLRGAHHRVLREVFGAAEAVVAQPGGFCYRAGGFISCESADQSSSMGNTYALLAAGTERVCAVLEDGAPVCFEGGPEAPDLAPRTVQALDVELDACAILDDGALSCWGNEQAFARTPDLPFEEVHVSQAYTVCARDTGGTVWCGASDRPTADLVEAADDLVAFDVFDEGTTAYYCGVTTGGTLECGYLPFARVGIDDARRVVAEVPGGGGYRAVSVSEGRACALTDDGHIVCWGEVDGW